MGADNKIDRRKGTAIAQVRGLGSAHSGAHHWQLMHLTSAGSLITTAYLVFSFLLLPDLSHATVTSWLAQPVPALGLALLIVAVFRHTQLGLQTLIDDYVHRQGSKFATMLVMNLALFAGGAFGLLSIARIAFSQPVQAAAQAGAVG